MSRIINHIGATSIQPCCQCRNHLSNSLRNSIVGGVSRGWSVTTHALSEEEAESAGAVITRTICRNRDERRRRRRRRLQSYRFSSDNHRRRPSVPPARHVMCACGARTTGKEEKRERERARLSIPGTPDRLLGF